MAIKKINNIAGINRLVPTLLVFRPIFIYQNLILPHLQ